VVLGHVLLHNNRLLAIACAGIFVTYLSCLRSTGAIPAFAQINNISHDITTSYAVNASLPEGGLNLLLYTKSGGLAPSNQPYTFNILSQELVFVDLTNNTVKKRMLTDDEISNMTDVFHTTNITGNEIYDIDSCPDCLQYGLLYSFIDFEKRIEINDLSLWTDRTQGTEGLIRLSQIIEDFVGRQLK